MCEQRWALLAIKWALYFTASEPGSTLAAVAAAARRGLFDQLRRQIASVGRTGWPLLAGWSVAAGEQADRRADAGTNKAAYFAALGRKSTRPPFRPAPATTTTRSRPFCRQPKDYARRAGSFAAM